MHRPVINWVKWLATFSRALLIQFSRLDWRRLHWSIASILTEKGFGQRCAESLGKLGGGGNRGNKHDLDFVLEHGGSVEKGRPACLGGGGGAATPTIFRKKTGEIGGALIHLRDSHHACRFVGAALAGEWTDGAIKQLESHGITVLHIPYVALINSFRIKGIDLDYAERASPAQKQGLVRSLKALPNSELTEIAVALEEEVAEQLNGFFAFLGGERNDRNHSSLGLRAFWKARDGFDRNAGNRMA